MKIGLLINSRLGLPTLQTFLGNRLDVSVVIPSLQTDDLDNIQELCAAHQTQVYTVQKETIGKQLKSWLGSEKPDMVMVLTFPYIIPSDILTNSKIPWFNFHFALLPKYGGGEPIFWQIFNRETEGGISIHKMTSELDSGPMALQQKVKIDQNENHGLHITNLGQNCVPLAINLLNLWTQTAGNIPLKEQSEVKIWPKPELKDITIKWDKMEAHDIKALVQACNPWNKGAIAFLNGTPIWICEVEINKITDEEKSLKMGSIYLHHNQLKTRCLNNMSLIFKIIKTNEGFYSGEKFAKFYPINGLKFDH